MRKLRKPPIMGSPKNSFSILFVVKERGSTWGGGENKFIPCDQNCPSKNKQQGECQRFNGKLATFEQCRHDHPGPAEHERHPRRALEQDQAADLQAEGEGDRLRRRAPPTRMGGSRPITWVAPLERNGPPVERNLWFQAGGSLGFMGGVGCPRRGGGGVLVFPIP